MRKIVGEWGVAGVYVALGIMMIRVLATCLKVYAGY